MYDDAVCFASSMPKSGNKTNGKRDVAAIGIASVNQNTAIRNTMAAARDASGFS
jgi:hypothetical protein